VGPDEINPTDGLASAGLGTWTPKAPMPTRRNALTAAVVQNQSGQYLLYALGGFGPVAHLRRVDAYNAATNTWSPRASLPEARSLTNGAAVIAGKIYVSGGNGPGVRQSRKLFVYSPGSNTWARKADVPVRSSHGLTSAIAGKLYVVSGFCECTPAIPPRLYRYDPATDTWTRRADPPHGVAGGVGGVINGKFYVSPDGSSVDVYDPATNRWSSPLGPQDAPIENATGLAFNGKLFVIGGDQLDANIARVRAYDPATNAWTEKQALPAPRQYATSGKAKNAAGTLQLVVVGGSFRTPSPDDDNVLYRETVAYTP
jgi:N-acetylneuraminic acid mutarotase